jgi:hypothetical protein
MPRGVASIDVHAPCDVVFDVLHDYALRLQWDTMLSEARLLGGASVAAKGVRSLCVGTWRGAFLAMETEYVTFERGVVAAVRLTNSPLLFARFAASIRHLALAGEGSRVTYTYSFRARPASLAMFVEPVVARMMQREVRTRLVALRDFVESGAARPARAARE